MSRVDEATVTLFRFDPTVDDEPRHETYRVPPEAWKGHKVIDVIRYLYENFVPGLAFREPCHQNVCGCCAMRVNKKAVLACAVFAEKEMVIEPRAGYQVIKDLVTEM